MALANDTWHAGRVRRVFIGEMGIRSIVTDIYTVVDRGEYGPTFISDISKTIAERIQLGLIRETSKPRPRLSKMGFSCPKAYWHSIHTPELAEVLPAAAKIKYTYGHILEALMIGLAREAGHSVEGEQDEVTFMGVVGHRDLVLDGCLCDIKSCSSLMFQEIQKGFLEKEDPFGYLLQLDAYLGGSLNDPLVQMKDKSYILAIDKTLGYIHLHEHNYRKEYTEQCVRRAIQISELSEPPACKCGTRPFGSSGNIELDVKASYSAYKHTCFPHLRSFKYSKGPVHLTKVIREPDVPELKWQTNGSSQILTSSMRTSSGIAEDHSRMHTL